MHISDFETDAMAELDELRRQFAEMQRRFGEQAAMLEQARVHQRETIRSYAYDLQEKLNIIQNREPSRVPDADAVLKEQLMLGLKDDSLRREMKRRLKDEKDLSFIQLMQEAITWSEEEEVQVPTTSKSSIRSRGAVHATTATENTLTPLTLEKLHEAIQQIAARQKELFQMVTNQEKVKPGKESKKVHL